LPPCFSDPHALVQPFFLSCAAFCPFMGYLSVQTSPLFFLFFVFFDLFLTRFFISHRVVFFFSWNSGTPPGVDCPPHSFPRVDNLVLYSSLGKGRFPLSSNLCPLVPFCTCHFVLHRCSFPDTLHSLPLGGPTSPIDFTHPLFTLPLFLFFFSFSGFFIFFLYRRAISSQGQI